MVKYSAWVDTQIEPVDSIAATDEFAIIRGGVAKSATSDKITEFVGLEVTGTTSAKSIVFHPQYNIFHTDLASSNVMGGNATQPNLVGIQIYRTEADGDGSTVEFNLSPGFTIANDSRVRVRANVMRADGLMLSYTNGSGMTVTGFGTATLTCTLDTAPAVGEIVEFTVYGDADDDASEPTLITTGGYDNSVNAIQSIAFAAHAKILNGDGHNAALSGSYITIGGSFNVAAGKGIWIGTNDADSVYNTAFGAGLILDGTANIGMGLNVRISGDGNVALGRDHNITHNYVAALGRGVVSRGDYEEISGAKVSTDASGLGLHSRRRVVLALKTTNATTDYMEIPSGQAGVEVATNSVWLVRYSVAAILSDGTKYATWEGTFAASNIGGTARIDGSTGDQALTSVYASGSPTWTAVARALGTKIHIKVAGAASETVRWSAQLEGVDAVGSTA